MLWLLFLYVINLWFVSCDYSDVERKLESPEKPQIQLVFWDPIKGFLNLMKPQFVEYAYSKCENTQCVVSDRRKDTVKAHMVIFHAPTHNKNGPRFPSRKNPGQIYTIINMEQPGYTSLGIAQKMAHLRKHFDLTATYNAGSKYPGTSVVNMPLSYYPLNILPVAEVLKPPALSFAEKNGYDTDAIAVTFISNCKAAGASERTAYITELMKHMSIHNYGGCLKNREEPEFPNDPKWPNQRRSRKVKITTHYKFILAFENAAVPDYVSEKVFEALFAGVVPVYRGAPEIANYMPGNDSFINANDLSPKQLATKLKALASNEEDYNKYFQFKKKSLITRFTDMAAQSYCHPNVLCRLCDYALNHTIN